MTVATQPFLADTAPHLDAAELQRAFGAGAAREARARANRSRQLGNHLHFCRWRQVERLVAQLDAREIGGTVH